MKHNKRSYLVPILILVGIVVTALFVMAITTIMPAPGSCPSCAQFNVPLTSPSGKYVLTVGMEIAGTHDEYYVALVYDNITGDTKALPYTEEAKGHRSALMWDDLDNIWSYSSDLGTYLYVNQGTEWVKKQASSFQMASLCPPKDFIEVIYKGEESFKECL